MIRQYYAPRRRGGDHPLGVGVIAAGTVFHLQSGTWFDDRHRGSPMPLDAGCQPHGADRNSRCRSRDRAIQSDIRSPNLCEARQ
jgi:hypothetical protein